MRTRSSRRTFACTAGSDPSSRAFFDCGSQVTPTVCPFSSASSRYNITGNLLTFDRVELRSKDMLMSGTGQIDFGTKKVKMTFTTDNPNWPNFCQKYGSNYKPEGDLQRKSDKLRVGVLGYLTQYGAGSDIYGGVVRGRVKYVGPKKFDAPAFSESANDKPEWNATTGVFYNNPEDASNRDASDNSHQTASPQPAFVRQSPGQDEAEAPLKYFSPFRVTRRA